MTQETLRCIHQPLIDGGGTVELKSVDPDDKKSVRLIHWTQGRETIDINESINGDPKVKYKTKVKQQGIKNERICDLMVETEMFTLE